MCSILIDLIHKTLQITGLKITSGSFTVTNEVSLLNVIYQSRKKYSNVLVRSHATFVSINLLTKVVYTSTE